MSNTIGNLVGNPDVVGKNNQPFVVTYTLRLTKFQIHYLF